MRKIVVFVLTLLLMLPATVFATGNTVPVGQTLQLYNGELGTKTWYSQNNAIAQVIEQNGNNCTVLGKAEGSAIIIVQRKYSQNVATQLPSVGGGTFWGVAPETKIDTRSYGVTVTPAGETLVSPNTSLGTSASETIGLTVGNITSAADFDKISNLFNGLAAVRKDGKIGFVDENMKLVIPLQYNFNGLDNNGGMKYNMFNKYGIALVHNKYPNSSLISDSIIDKTGKAIIEPDFFNYCILDTLTDGELIYVHRYDRKSLNPIDQWGAYDMQGNIVIPFKNGEGENITSARGENWNENCVFWDGSSVYGEPGTPIDFSKISTSTSTNNSPTNSAYQLTTDYAWYYVGSKIRVCFSGFGEKGSAVPDAKLVLYRNEPSGEITNIMGVTLKLITTSSEGDKYETYYLPSITSSLKEGSYTICICTDYNNPKDTSLISRDIRINEKRTS